MKTKKGNLLIGFAILLSVVLITTLIGVFALRSKPIVLQGEAEATEVRVSGKVPGRILEFKYKEGMSVKKGDTLVYIDSPEVLAKMMQAQAARSAAMAQSKKAEKGSRKEIIAGAYEQWQKSLIATDFAKKSFERIQNLYNKGVIPAQKRDEVEAQYRAAEATSKAAKSQYDMALNGAQLEDKEAAEAMVHKADGAIAEVGSYMAEATLIAPITGEISDIFPKEGELVGTGAPIMNIMDLDDMWITYNLREDFLSKINMGKILKAKVPALGNREIEMEVYYMKPMAGYADWKATKVSGQYDAKTFEVRTRPTVKQEGLRPGMTVLLEWEKI